jgi:hypothetical protein
MNEIEEEFLTIEAAAVLIGRSASWIRWQIRNAGFPPPLDNLRGRWRRADVESWMRSNPGQKPILETRG